MKKLPSFMRDDSESMKYEEIIDFFISWTIRCADELYKEETKVHKNAKRILSVLMFNDACYLDNKKVENVETWKQWKQIDVSAHLDIDGEKYVFLIENKMYSSIREGQLRKYKDIVEHFYQDKPEIKKKIFAFIRPDYEINNNTNEKEFVLKEGYNYANLCELTEALLYPETGNELFDAFWLKW